MDETKKDLPAEMENVSGEEKQEKSPDLEKHDGKLAEPASELTGKIDKPGQETAEPEKKTEAAVKEDPVTTDSEAEATEKAAKEDPVATNSVAEATEEAAVEDPVATDSEVKVIEEPAVEESIPNEKDLPLVSTGAATESDIIEDKEKELLEPEVQPEIAEVDYSGLSNRELVDRAAILISERPVQEIRKDIDHIKTNFYKNLNKENEKKKEAFLKEGGLVEDFNPPPDPLEDKLKNLLDQYKAKKAAYSKQLELEKQTNLEEKYRILEGIKNLVNKEESINKTFQEFRELQTQWRAIGLVPQSKLKDLWESYHYHVEKFYDYIKINKELRDLDLKKNMELKNYLCDKAEDLLLEPNIVLAFKTLQKYHERWREIGPVPHEIKEALWERFKAATAKINKKHQEHFEVLKENLKKNLQAKTELCEKVEQILQQELKGHREWEQKSREIIEIQKVWKTIGFAPKKYNNQIYERFRNACDAFFAGKRDFYAENKEIQKNNLQLKTDLCMQAEALQNSENWKQTTEDLIRLQKKWKEIGPVPRRYSEDLWKRFRAACDTFFNKKAEHYSNTDKKYKENLKLKKDLIAEIKEFRFGKDMEENFKHLQTFQKRWAEIGYVPIKEKDKISLEYRDTINHLFDELNIDSSRKDLLKFRNKLENMGGDQRSASKLHAEREKFINKIKKLESDIVLWENNIGFFARSASADALIKEVTQKIEQARENVKLFESKVKMIDQYNKPKA